MNYSAENTANDFLEISSKQRLSILLRLAEKKSTITSIAKALDATVPEVYRNFQRLIRVELIAKDNDGSYYLTTYGKTICAQIPSLIFVSKNKKYFKNHDFGDMPIKFIQRIGVLDSGQYIKGFVKVQEQWKDLYRQANEYIFNSLSEVPYTTDFIAPLMEKLKKGIKVNSIFSEFAVLPKERKKTLDKTDFKNFIQKGTLERRIRSNVQVAVVLNEKEAGVMFPNMNGNADMSEMFYGTDPLFHEWCLDYFRYCWHDSSVFQESKLKNS